VLNLDEEITHAQLAVLRDAGYNEEARYSRLLDEIRDADYQRLISATTLELVNDDDYRMFAFHELNRAGREQRDGLHIPLRHRFRLQAQNSSPDLLLTVTVYERATDKIIFQRSAQQYGVVAAHN